MKTLIADSDAAKYLSFSGLRRLEKICTWKYESSRSLRTGA
jgi:hypothetical protein